MQGLEEYYYNHSSQSKVYSPWSDTATWNSDYQRNGSCTSTLESIAIPQTETHKSSGNDLEPDDISRDKEDHESNQKHTQVAATLRWLNENYERSEGVCLPRCVLYTHYLDFCKKLSFSPAGAATFGKIIRQRFPKLTTRRLGTRGQSKYHYYGIGVKETSIYYHSVYSGKGLSRFSGTKVKTEGSNRKYSLSSKTGTLLPDFPDAENLILPETVDTEKMKTFLMMYRTHCQRILDTVIAANFEEVESFLLHFWQGMPDHLVDLFDSAITSDVIALCDFILYKVLIDVLIPTSIQDLPESLSIEISTFIDNLPIWLKTSLENTPVHIQRVKNEVSRVFTQSIKRHLSFIHLAQTARSVLSNTDCVTNMTEDMAEINLTEISRQATFLHPGLSKQGEIIFNAFEEFQSLLNRQVSIETYTEWMDELIDKCVLKFPKNKNGGFYESKAADFLLHWTLIGSLMMRDLTLNSASSFGSFHLLHMMLDEYAFLVLETQNDLIREQALQTNLQKHMKNAEVIKIVARVRTVCQSNATTKCRKRKIDSPDINEVHASPEDDFNDKSDASDAPRKNNTGTVERYPQSEGNRRNTPNCYSREYYRSLNHSSDSSFHPYQGLQNGVYDKAYMTHMSGNYTYPEYRNNCSSFSSQQLPPAYPDDSSHHHGQSYHSLPTLTRSVSPMTPAYWPPTDPRPFPIHQDSFNHLTYSSRFDTCKKSGYFRSGFYETVGPTFGMPALESSQYVIQDPPLYQDECYHHHANLPNNISAYTPLSKTLFSQNY